ncbi:LD-carboxypeptidase [Yimella sp. cx-51]|uniref:S66 peptidase family protein n=1 Tax=Yimella sp. cx-51 TaxID=2770551 RepID=UPI00165E0309|nr:LD-carboxypeptidase [Yimella sp. cx-51]MBC9956824.1 LD-carboxypeptidase [Yimella sp. cx-51]QTH39052.1 LD-carboxypeptidase [Yimella sp. cx-51]
MTAPQRPAPLLPGAKVAIITASGPVNPDALAKGLLILRDWDLEPVVLPSAMAAPSPAFTHLAGTDQLRADDLVQALTSPEFDAVIFAKGGDGAQRALELIDWQALSPLRPEPRWVVGFSDVTAVQEALLRHWGWVSLYGPMPATSYLLAERAQASLHEALFERPSQLVFPDAWTITSGTAEGIVMGGCCALVTSSIGTVTSVPADGGLLFLEDEFEEPHRLDRMFTQLRRSNFLDGLRGVLLGNFDQCGDPQVVNDLLRDRFGDLGVPVLAGLDVGHGVPLQSLPIGARAVMDTDTRTLQLVD